MGLVRFGEIHVPEKSCVRLKPAAAGRFVVGYDGGFGILQYVERRHRGRGRHLGYGVVENTREDEVGGVASELVPESGRYLPGTVIRVRVDIVLHRGPRSQQRIA